MAGLWPGRTKCVAMLTFDMDGASGMLRREPSVAKRPSVMSQGDFGPEVGTPRILDILGANNIPATFFIPGWVAERHPDAVKSVVRAGHEVAHHGYMHEAPATLSSKAEEAELLDKGSAALKKVTGTRPAGYRSPAWDVSEHTLGLLAEREFLYDSSLMGHDEPYFVDAASGWRVEASKKPALSRGAKRGPTTLVELPVHWSLDDAPYYPFNPAVGRNGPLLSPQIALDTWMWEFDMVHRHGGAFMLTMHPYISGHWSRLNGLERLIAHIKAAKGVEFMTCIDVATAWRKKGV